MRELGHSLMQIVHTPPVLIACPVTGELVPVGTNVASLEALEGEYLLIACPECGGNHDWTPADAVLAPE